MNDSNDSSHSIDIDSLFNVILPLDLIKHHPFPGETSFDRLHLLIHDYFSKCSPTNNLTISPAFLFLICTTLWNNTHAGTVQECLLPAVLRRLKWWRVLPLEERYSEEVIEKLAMDLASFVNSRGVAEEDSKTGLGWMRIRWIGADSEYTDLHAGESPVPVEEEKINVVTSDSPNPVVPTVPKRSRPVRSSLGHICVNVRQSEEAEFRSGCCTCHTPRHSKTHQRIVSAPISRSHHSSRNQPPTAVPNFPIPSTLTRTDPPILKPNGVDENIPPLPVLPIATIHRSTKTHRKSASVPAVQPRPLSTTKQILRPPSVASSRPTRAIKSPANLPVPITKPRNPSLSRLSTSTTTSNIASSTSSQVPSCKSVTLASRPPFGFSTRANTRPPSSLSLKPATRPKIPPSSNRSAAISARAPKP